MQIQVVIDVPENPDGIVTSSADLLSYAIDAEDRSPDTPPEREIAECLAARLDEFYVGGACVVLDPALVTVKVVP